MGPPEGEAGWASLRHQEHEAQLVPGADGVCAGGRSPLGVEQGGCPRPATALVDRAVRCQRPSSPPPSPLAATEAEPAQGFKVPSLAKNGRESGRPGLPVTFIDEVDSEDEVPQEAKLPCSGASAPPQYHPHPSGPGHLAELQHRTGNTFTVVPKRKPVALQANGEARPREAEEEGPGGLSEPPAALGPSLKKRYPTVHEIEVIGGYLALQKSCLTKAGSSRKKVSGGDRTPSRAAGEVTELLVPRTPGLRVGQLLLGPQESWAGRPCPLQERLSQGNLGSSGSAGTMGTACLLCTLKGWWGGSVQPAPRLTVGFCLVAGERRLYFLQQVRRAPGSFPKRRPRDFPLWLSGDEPD